MTGDDRVRFCGRCEKSVYDLSALTTEQAEALLRAYGESLCVRFYRRRDGTVMTSDCPVGRGKHRIRRTVAAALAAGVLAVGGFAASSSVCEPEPLMGAVAIQEPAVVEQGELIEAEELMGDVAFDEPAPPAREVRAGGVRGTSGASR